jgi:PAS domain S-box-containing protein
MNELGASEARFRAIAENIREVFWMTNATKSVILYVSPAYETIWGRTCQSLREAPASWLDAVEADDRARVEAWVAGQREGSTEITYRIVRPDGTKRWIRDRSFPVRDDDGEITSFVGLADDVTALIRSEERLAQAQRLEALGKLAGGIAHDFNNMLSVIICHSDFLVNALEPGELRKDAEVVREAAVRAADVTRQLLAFSHQQVMQPKVLDLGQVVVGMKRMLGRVLGEDIDLVLPEAPSACFIDADPGQIERVIMNLAVNARDAMPQGGRLTIDVAKLTIGPVPGPARAGLEAGPYVVLAVGDTGTGMDTETRKRIFEPFFTTKEKGKGTGLGLASVLGIVEQSGGAIRVESAPGKGATFSVYLPAVAGGADSRAMPTQPGAALRGTETVLLAEDEPHVRATARSILRRCGYTVLEAQNAGEAILLCEQHGGPIDLLLTDIVMPYMSGRKLAERLAPLRPDMKVLYVSGYAGELVEHHGVASGSVPFLQKPITPEALARKVREVLG